MKHMEPALVVMAAGLGSRFGEGIKQLNPVGPSGEIIIDYSVHDAIEAGFRKIVFIIRHDIEEAFRQVIGDRLQAVCDRLGVEIRYAYQDAADLPAGFAVPEGRKKPWGTCHAVLSCRNIVREPFAVINADDYYGKEAYRNLYTFLKSVQDNDARTFCMVGFVLEHTLSPHGVVTRGICQMDSNQYLQDIVETRGIEKTKDGASAGDRCLNPQMLVSMNMWGVTPVFMGMLERGFQSFLERLGEDALTGEFLLPEFMDQLLKEQQVTVKVLQTSEQWFGVTYQEDREAVNEAFLQLHQDGVYEERLFDDLLKKE